MSLPKGHITDDRNELVDVPLLYLQRGALIRAHDALPDEGDKELLDGLINYCDSQLDYLDPTGIFNLK